MRGKRKASRARLWVSTSVRGGAPALWRELGVRHEDADKRDAQLFALQLSVWKLINTGRWTKLPALVRNVSDGRIALIRYSMWSSRNWRRPGRELEVENVEYPLDQVQARALHEVQRMLISEVILCDFENCGLEDSKRKQLIDAYCWLVSRGLKSTTSAARVRSYGRALVSKINGSRFGPVAA